MICQPIRSLTLTQYKRGILKLLYKSHNGIDDAEGLMMPEAIAIQVALVASFVGKVDRSQPMNWIRI